MNKKPLDILSKYYGYFSFRKGQENIIDSIINKKDVLAIMPTGGGKSICYQVPALCLDGITIVISPLISLMKDQVDTLKTMGIEAELINSTLSASEYIEILQNIDEDKYKLLYVAPERLDSSEFISLIKNKNISQVAIDEAHCISSWGHDFRTSYKRIPYFIKSLNKRPIITAFTATASDEVRDDILNILELNDPNVYITGFDRENLAINIVKSSSKNKYLLDYIQNHQNESGIIYAATRKEVDTIYEGLLKRNYSVSKYHAGLSTEDRRVNQEKFIKDEIKIMVATNAFGMGIDKFNVRWVIHYNVPQSIENYYQEIGRAGRDSEPSECVLLFAPGDVHTQKYLIEVGVENPTRKKIQYKKLQQMVDLVYSNDCYRKSILGYFGDELEGNCDNCSNCLDDGEVIDKTLDAKKVISCIARMKKSFGTTMIIDVLRGSKNKRVLEQGFDKLTTYGIMKNYSAENLKTFINTLTSHGFLEVVENVGMRGSYPTIRLNEKSLGVMKDSEVVQFKESKVSKSSYVHNELYDILVALRSNLARENSIAPYMVFGDGTLKEMSSKYPTNKESMLNISGVGEVKYERYGTLFEDLIKDYVNKNNININNTTNNNVNSNSDYDDLFMVSTDVDLYKRLVAIRHEISQIERTLEYMILHKNTLKEISGRYPVTEDQLSDIGGLGPVKINKYGKDILNEVNMYIKENDIEPVWTEKKRKKLIIDGEDRKADEVILDLLNQGQSLSEICDDMEVSISTALGYVCDYVKYGNKINFEIKLDNLYNEDDKELILKAIEKLGEDKISAIKKALPEHIRYESIRAIILEKLLEQ